MNLSNATKSYLSRSTVDAIAGKTGETTSGISSFFNAAIPAIAGSLATRSDSDSRHVFALAKETFATGKLGNLTNLVDQDESVENNSGIRNFLKNDLFEDKWDNLVQILSSYAGLQPSTGKSALDIAAFATLGALGSHIKENNLNTEDLAAFLDNQRASLASSFPEGFNKSSIAALLGITGLTPLQKEIATHNVTTPGAFAEGKELSKETIEQNEQPYGKGWMIPLIILLAVIAVAWSLLKGCNHNAASTVVEQTEAISVSPAGTAETKGELDATGNWLSDRGADKTINLPDGTELTVGENSTEFKLFNFITNPDLEIDTQDKTKNWISFDRVFFATSNADLTDESQNQIKNIALILKNFPKASIKIGGYTDNTGSADVNTKLSQERADVVAQKLKDLGGRIDEAVGYGPEHPVATNETAEGRAQNRRVDLKLASK